MRRPGWIWLLVGILVAGLLVVPAAPSHAWRRGGGAVFIGIGPPFWGPAYPYYWYPPPYYPPTQIVVEQPPVYVQQETEPPAWYYCPSAKGYYPQVQNCPEAWVKVAPRAP